MLDNKGSFYIVDGIIAIVLVLIVFLIVNSTIGISSPDYSYQSKDIKSAQDVMELLSGKIDFQDETFLEKISNRLDDGKYSKQTLREVSDITKNRMESYGILNYRFSENDEVFAQSGDWSKAQNVSVALRNYANHTYTLQIW